MQLMMRALVLAAVLIFAGPRSEAQPDAPALARHIVSGLTDTDDDYWGDEPVWGHVTTRIVSNNAARTAALLAGDVQLIDNVPTTDAAKLGGDSRAAISETVGLRIVYLALDHMRDGPTPNVTGPNIERLDRNPLRDLRVRQALSIADEPTTVLDITIQAQILSEMHALCGRFGTALVWITHDLSVVASLAHHIAEMYTGRIVEKGSVDQVLDYPLHRYTHGLSGSVPSRNKQGERLRGIPGMTPSVLNLPAGCAFRIRCAQADALRMRSAEVYGRRRPCAPLLPSIGRCRRMSSAMPGSMLSRPARAEPMIELRGVAKRFKKASDGATRPLRRPRRQPTVPIVRAVDGVDLVVRRGEVLGLVGESGCGKSTLGRMAAGILPPSEGQILYGGRDRATLNKADAKQARLRVQMIFQDPVPPLREVAPGHRSACRLNDR